MSKLVIATAVLWAAVFSSMPAFAEPYAVCQQRCLTNCSGKGNFCAINCEGRCARFGTAKRG